MVGFISPEVYVVVACTLLLGLFVLLCWLAAYWKDEEDTGPAFGFIIFFGIGTAGLWPLAIPGWIIITVLVKLGIMLTEFFERVIDK